jgi:hypothetical protein
MQDGGEPESSAADNVRTLRLVEALYESGETGQVIRIEPDGPDARP